MALPSVEMLERWAHALDAQVSMVIHEHGVPIPNDPESRAFVADLLASVPDLSAENRQMLRALVRQLAKGAK